MLKNWLILELNKVYYHVLRLDASSKGLKGLRIVKPDTGG
jgi:hypothetical protein